MNERNKLAARLLTARLSREPMPRETTNKVIEFVFELADKFLAYAKENPVKSPAPDSEVIIGNYAAYGQPVIPSSGPKESCKHKPDHSGNYYCGKCQSIVAELDSPPEKKECEHDWGPWFMDALQQYEERMCSLCSAMEKSKCEPPKPERKLREWWVYKNDNGESRLSSHQINKDSYLVREVLPEDPLKKSSYDKALEHLNNGLKVTTVEVKRGT